MMTDFIFVVVLGISTLIFQLVGMPFVLAFFGKETVRPQWWAWGRVVGWLLVGLTLWLVASLGLSVNTTVGFWTVLAVAGVVGYAVPQFRARERMRFFVRRFLREILQQEVIFTFGFITLGIIRSYQPQVLDLEKFMNAGLMLGYLRSPTLPAQDFWFAGESINYYSFGHFLGSLLLRFWRLPVEVGFNFLPGWVAGLTLVQSWALVQTVLRQFVVPGVRARWPLMVGGLVGALLIVFGGNTHPIWYWLTNGSFTGYWYPEAARFIEYTIHEFPAYSFVVSDVHAHFWDIAVVLLGLGVMWHWLQALLALKGTALKRPWKNSALVVRSLVLGTLLGVMGMINTWDMVVYAMMLSVIGVGVFVWFRKHFQALVFTSLPMASATLVALAPWLLNFTSIVEGVRWVTERSPWWQLVALWTGHVAVALVVLLILAKMGRRSAQRSAGWLWLVVAGVTGIVCVVLPEIIFFKDIYPTYPRANTMFKFTFQAMILFSLLAGWLAGWLADRVSARAAFPARFTPWVLRAALAFFVIGVLSYPFISYPQFYEQFAQQRGWDGLQWLQTSAPADYAAILWLRTQTTGRPTVLEAVGESYTRFGRVSVFSGLPTILGWRAHEWLWRGGFEMPAARTEEVRAIYEQPLGREAAAALARYDVQFIFVGDKEREAYQLDMSGLRRLGEIVFQQANTVIIKRNL